MPSPLTDAPGPTALRVGRYELLLELQDEGFVTRSLARVHGPNAGPRLVELSRVRRALGRQVEVRAAFLAEARAAARVRHANYVHPIDTLVHDGDLYGVTEFTLGVRLDELCAVARQRGYAVPVAVTLRILLDVLSGLSALHTAQMTGPRAMVHGDIAPTNVLVGQRGEARLIHSGLATVTTRAGATGEKSGRLAYKAPEQLRTGTNLPIEATADVFAVGVLLWECLAGAELFKAERDLEVVGRVLTAPIAFALLDARAPAQLVAIAGTALERAPERRYPSAVHLAETLIRADLPIASSEDVAAFVNLVLGPVLEARRERVQALVSEGDGGAASGPSSSRIALGDARRSRSMRTPVGIIYPPEGAPPSSARLLSARSWAPSSPPSGVARAAPRWPAETLSARPRASLAGARPPAIDVRTKTEAASGLTLSGAALFWLLTLVVTGALAFAISCSSWWPRLVQSMSALEAPVIVAPARAPAPR